MSTATYAAAVELPATVALRARYGHSRTILLAQCCYNADILHYIEDYSHFAEASARRTAKLATGADPELFANMQFYAARATLYSSSLRFRRNLSLESARVEQFSIAYCRALFDEEYTGQPQ